MSYLGFDVDVSTYVTSERDSDNEWSRDSTDGSVTIEGCRLLKEDAYDALPASFDVKVGDKIWLVWAQYSTGDSFGRYGAQYELCSVFPDYESASKEAARLNTVTDFSVPWTGYFEDLDEIHVTEFEVKA